MSELSKAIIETDKLLKEKKISNATNRYMFKCLKQILENQITIMQHLEGPVVVEKKE